MIVIKSKISNNIKQLLRKAVVFSNNS